MMHLEIVYLYHSGFIIETDDNIVIFDYYKDPSKTIMNRLRQGKQAFILSSHNHSDHFNSEIFRWDQYVSNFYLSDDILIPESSASEKTVLMRPYEMRSQGNFTVCTYGSTDAGVSFSVEMDGWRIFHAGDLNWWHWHEDTLDNQRIAERSFKMELDHLAKLNFDVAFFPVDSRLEQYRTLGVEEFCRRVKVDKVIAMHTCGQKWLPSENFLQKNPKLSIWCPDKSGQSIKLYHE